VIFALPSGQVSSVVDDPGGFFIFKAESKNTMPLDSVRPEIKQRLAQENYMKEMRDIFQGADAKLNPQYFGTDHLDLGFPPEQEGGGRPRPIRPAMPQQ
jgi:parvulin-like peptidyl-prolyl isomerase